LTEDSHTKEYGTSAPISMRTGSVNDLRGDKGQRDDDTDDAYGPEAHSASRSPSRGVP
jgi:hypothetical protein